MEERVEVLVLIGTNVTDPMCEELSHSQTLTKLGLRSNQQITNVGFRSLTRIRTLKQLKIIDCRELTDELFAGIRQEFWPELYHLFLGGAFTQ